MARTACLFLIMLFLTNVSQGQTDGRVVIKNILSHNQAIPTIAWDGTDYVQPEKAFAKFPQVLVKDDHDLFVALNGTGRLYKATSRNDSIVFERIDSTVYFGSNFNSFIFSYRDTIFSLGGYGFWKTNGLLRYFVKERNEWEIIRLNQETPVLTGKDYDLIWYDKADGKIYLGFTREENYTTTDEKSKSDFHYKTMVLDLGKKQWFTLGSLTGFFRDDLNDITGITSSPWGQMITLKKRTLFLNYKENAVYQLKDDKQRIIDQLPSSTGDMHVWYFEDSVFFSGISKRNLLDSVRLSQNDLTLLNEKIYTPDNQLFTAYTHSSYWKILTVTLVFLGLLGLIGSGYYFSRHKSKDPSNTILPAPKGRKPSVPEIFSKVEIDVIKAILKNAEKGYTTSISELNTILGVNRKSGEVQKKQRSDTISSINKKYAYINKGNGELIERKQAESDKRSFEYYIDYFKINELRNFI